MDLIVVNESQRILLMETISWSSYRTEEVSVYPSLRGIYSMRLTPNALLVIGSVVIGIRQLVQLGEVPPPAA